MGKPSRKRYLIPRSQIGGGPPQSPSVHLGSANIDRNRSLGSCSLPSRRGSILFSLFKSSAQKGAAVDPQDWISRQKQAKFTQGRAE
ncbi:hypothetical protein JTE90_026458 [Oedothorax gibbosus]|uniref:Uncharacterized protein n=1 Tax=Oedothorax gibbosus TaxID=931172 RepID=A0AAV6VS15_9ARAC|nr:hypothetical protein JTE90_026458 [Oedothorax gibbosus]